MYKRLFSYFLGLFTLTIAISLSIKANLGISPVSSVPYTLTVVWGVEIGIATVIFHTVLVIIQYILLRDKFSMKNLLQLPVGIVFGYFTSFSVFLMNFLPPASNILMSLIYLILSIIIISIGEILYLPANLVPLASSGIIQVIAAVSAKQFSRIKIIFDVLMVGGSAAVCLVCVGSLGSVGLGTVISAFLVGPSIKASVRLVYYVTGIQLNLKPGYSE